MHYIGNIAYICLTKQKGYENQRQLRNNRRRRSSGPRNHRNTLRSRSKHFYKTVNSSNQAQQPATLTRCGLFRCRAMLPALKNNTMRKIVSSFDVAHFWANQTQDEARTSNGNFYYECKTIYSYGRHFPIAVHHDGVVLFTYRTYSPTTSNHVRMVSGACSHLTKVYCKNPDDAAAGIHSRNIEDFEELAKEQALKIASARKPELYTSKIASIRGMFEKYCLLFNLKEKSFGLSYIFIQSKSDSPEAFEAAKKRILAAQAAKKERAEKEHALALEKFRSGETNHIYTRNGQDYLRYNAEKQRVETSQGVQIPEAEARRLYAGVLRAVDTGKCDICGTKVLYYKITSIDKKWLKVGCHNIAIDEIKRLTASLGW